MNVIFHMVIYLTITIMICSCSAGNQKSEKCKYKAPTAVFSPELKEIVSHRFDLSGMKGVETIRFDNQTRLELIQTGCNEIRQHFTFTLNKALDGDEAFWIKQTEEQFRYLSKLSGQYASYALWANIFRHGAHLIRLGETFEPEPNTFITVDHIPSPEYNLLVVILEKKG